MENESKKKQENIVFDMLTKVSDNTRKIAEKLADDVFNQYLEIAINNDMTKNLYANEYYKYFPDRELIINKINEIGMMLAYEKIKNKSIHCSLIRIPDENCERFCLEASSLPLKTGYVGKCLIYGIQ